MGQEKKKFRKSFYPGMGSSIRREEDRRFFPRLPGESDPHSFFQGRGIRKGRDNFEFKPPPEIQDVRQVR